MRQADWYFDFVSPFSYLGFLRHGELAKAIEIRCRPILFAAVLDHWGQKGPAEVPGKRLWTYRWCNWRASQQAVPFRFPASHPFNPLPYLRLALAAGCAPEALRTIFRALWTTGADPADPALVRDLAANLGIEEKRLADPEIKQALRDETDQAIARGVFGVPSFVVDGELFWGADATGFLKAWLTEPAILEGEEMRRVASLPVGAERRR